MIQLIVTFHSISKVFTLKQIQFVFLSVMQLRGIMRESLICDQHKIACNISVLSLSCSLIISPLPLLSLSISLSLFVSFLLSLQEVPSGLCEQKSHADFLCKSLECIEEWPDVSQLDEMEIINKTCASVHILTHSPFPFFNMLFIELIYSHTHEYTRYEKVSESWTTYQIVCALPSLVS